MAFFWRSSIEAEFRNVPVNPSLEAGNVRGRWSRLFPSTTVWPRETFRIPFLVHSKTLHLCFPLSPWCIIDKNPWGPLLMCFPTMVKWLQTVLPRLRGGRISQNPNLALIWMFYTCQTREAKKSMFGHTVALSHKQRMNTWWSSKILSG